MATGPIDGSDAGDRTAAETGADHGATATTTDHDATPAGGDPDSTGGAPATAGSDVSGLSVRVRSLWRFFVVCYQFLPLVWAYLRDRRRFVLVGGRRAVTGADQYRRAEYLLETLLDLGPTFIKFGQMLSTRPDVLPGPYVDVLSQLQDKVPPDDWAEIRPVVEGELGPVEDVYDSFDREPISGASLGQVYTACVDGERVAVKILRPDIRERVAADLRVLYTLAPVLVWFAPPGQAFTMENLVEEFADTVHEEMDYVHEAAMLAAVRENFADDDGIRVPRYLPVYSTDRVLTMEYVAGTKITDVEELDRMGVDREALVRRLEEAYIEMIVEDGLFHADPHPGNLAVEADGTIVFYDFGMTGTLTEETRDRLFEFYVAVAEEDVDAVIDAFVAMNALDPGADRGMMREVFEFAIEQFRGQEVEQYRIQEFVGEFESELYDFPMRLPQNLALVVRVSTVLEGVCRTLDPEFDFVAVVSEYVRERQSAEGFEWIRAESGERAWALVGSSLRIPPKLESTVGRIDDGSLAVEIAILDDERLIRRTIRQILAGGAVAGNVLVVSLLFATLGARPAGIAALAFLPLGLLVYRSFRRRGPIGPTVQFTRQEMRERRRG